MHPQLVNLGKFFEMSRERYRIKQRRDAGQPWPWTEDKVLQEWRFTNVFREDDKTTTWFRENVRDPLSRQGNFFNIAAGTMIFRWFNRISTGELIKPFLIGELPWDSEVVEEILRDVRPIVTGAYMIKTFNDMNKLDGILLAIDQGLPKLATMPHKWGTSLEGAWKDLIQIHFLGGFMAHEIVQDLRYTPVLQNATDVNTWTHLGPGAIRGMSWMLHDNEFSLQGTKTTQKMVLPLMRDILAASRDPQYWPSDWPQWEMHQVEFGLCEFSKYMKASKGIPQKRRYQQEE